MPEIPIDARDFQAAMRRHFAAKLAAMHEEAHDTAKWGHDHADRLAHARGIPATGEYVESFHVVDRARGPELRNDAPHAGAVEYGRSPGTPPPFDPIYDWVVAKLNLNDPEATSAALLIRDKIAREGTEPRHLMRQVYYGMADRFRLQKLRVLRAWLYGPRFAKRP